MAEYGMLAGFGALLALAESAGAAIQGAIAGVGSTLHALLKSAGV